MDRRAGHRRLHRSIVTLACVPLAALALRAAGGNLGPNPIETLTHESGEWALRFLLASLAITPLRQLARIPWLAPYRRSFGLLAFAYASVHLLVYGVLDQELSGGAILEDVLERPYITVGFGAFLILLPLAATSTKAAMRRMRGRWQWLHRSVYAAGVLAALHFLWLTKADLLEPAIYAGILGGLLAYRAIRWAREKAQLGSGAGVSGPLSGRSGEAASAASTVPVSVSRKASRSST